MAQGNIDRHRSIIEASRAYNGTVTFQGASGTYSGDMTGSGSLRKTGNGTLTLTGDNGYTGGTTVTSGTLRGDTNGIQGNIANHGNITFEGGSGTYAGDITGSGSLNKIGNGQLTINGVPSYSGQTTVQGGVLSFSNPNNLASDIDVQSGAELWFGNTPDRVYNGDISGAGSVLKAGSGTLTINGVPSYSGTTTVQAGVLSFSNPNNLASDIEVLSGAELWFGNTPDRVYSGSISGAGSLKAGSGRLVLGGANTFSGMCELPVAHWLVTTRASSSR